MKFGKMLLAVCLVLCMALGMCACAQSGNADTTAAQQPQQQTTAPEDTTAAADTTAADDGKMTYTVKVVDQDGNPMAGVLVQLCLDTCLPGMTNDDGAAEFAVVQADYKVSVAAMPEGYEHAGEDVEFYFDDGAYELTITLKSVA